MKCCDHNLIKNVRGIFKCKVFSKKNETLLTHAVYRIVHKSLSTFNDKSTLHGHPSYLCSPEALSLVRDPLSGHGRGSQNHIEF
jgi:hypothetical protein